MKKKLLAILLAVVMVMTLLPTVAFAATEITAITLDTNFTDLVGKKFGDVKDSIFTNVKDGDDNTLEAVNVFMQYCPGEESPSVALGDNDVIQAGNYQVWGIIAATSGDSFPFVVEEFFGSTFSGNVNGSTFNPMSSVLPLAQKNGNATPGNMYESCPAAGETATHLALGYTVTLEAPAEEEPNNKANIKGSITPADFGYTMVIPASTLLTEAAHENVLLGTTAEKVGDGIVSVKDIKHGGGSMEISYTVDLANGNLTDGTTTIEATYQYKQGTNEFATIVDDDADGATKVTVYTGGEIVGSIVNVSADEDDWNAAPVGDYNATVVFNFKNEEAEAADEGNMTVKSILPDNFPTAKSGSTWRQSGGSGALYVDGTQLKAQVSSLTFVALSEDLTSAGEGIYTCTVGARNETWTFTVVNGKFTQVVIEGLTNDLAEVNGTYTKTE